jgi:hypothetical protein
VREGNFVAGIRVVSAEEEAMSDEVARAKRVMARRARRLARELALEEDRARLLKHAEELEAQADEIERRAREHGSTTDRPINAAVDPSHPRRA